MDAKFSSSPCSPSQQPQPSHRTALRIVLSPSSSPPPFPGIAAYWEPPAPPSFPHGLLPRNCIACSTEGEAGLLLGALPNLFFLPALKTRPLVTAARPHSLFTDWREVALCQPRVRVTSGTSELFCWTSGRALGLPWPDLFSVWVSFKRDERFVASQAPIEIFQKWNWKHLCFSF